MTNNTIDVSPQGNINTLATEIFNLFKTKPKNLNQLAVNSKLLLKAEIQAAGTLVLDEQTVLALAIKFKIMPHHVLAMVNHIQGEFARKTVGEMPL